MFVLVFETEVTHVLHHHFGVFGISSAAFLFVVVTWSGGTTVLGEANDGKTIGTGNIHANMDVLWEGGVKPSAGVGHHSR